MNTREMLEGFGLTKSAHKELMQLVGYAKSRASTLEEFANVVSRLRDMEPRATLYEIYLAGFLLALEAQIGLDPRTAVRVAGGFDFDVLTVRNSEHMEEHRLWAAKEGILVRWEGWMDYCDLWGRSDEAHEIIPSADMGEHGFVCVVGKTPYVFGLHYSPEEKDWSVHS